MSGSKSKTSGTQAVYPPPELQVIRGRCIYVGGQASIYISRRRIDHTQVIEKVFNDEPTFEVTKRMLKKYEDDGILPDTPIPVVQEILGKINSINQTQWEYFTRVLLFPTPEYSTMQLEFCDGGNLHELAGHYQELNEPISESFIWHVYDSLAKALCFMHTGSDIAHTPPHGWKPIVHRDIKTNNVLLQLGNERGLGFPKVKLTDFDFASFYDRHKCKWAGGVKGYIPPEQDEADTNSPCARPAGDVWAVGATIYDVIAGDVPKVEYKRRYGRQREEVTLLNPWHPKEAFALREEDYTKELQERLLMALCVESKRATAPQLVEAVGAAAEEYIGFFKETMALGFDMVRIAPSLARNK